MAAGELVGDDLVESVVRDRLDQHDWNYGFVVDGFPRNGRQAEFFLESYDIDGVIHLDLPDDEVRRRVLSRRLCTALRHGLQPDRRTGPRWRAAATSAAASWSPAPTTPRRRWPPGCATTTRRPARCSSCSAARSVVHDVDARPAADEVQQTIREALGLPAYAPPD